MKRFLLKNTTLDNVSFNLKTAKTDNLNYPGLGAVLVNEDKSEVDICVNPLTAEIKKIYKSKTDCIDLGAGDLFAVEVDGVVYPHYFKPWQLVKFFDGGEDVDLVKIGFCSDYDEKPMIVRNSGSDSVTIYSQTKLDILHDPEYVVLSKDENIDGTGIYIYTLVWERPHLPHARIYIKASNKGEQIKGLQITNVREIEQWYSGGYDGFYVNYGVGPNVVKVPDTIPPNTFNLDWMFYRSSYFNQDISSWDFENIHSANYFMGSESFDQNLSTLCVPNLQTQPTEFVNSSNQFMVADKLPVWGTCPTQPIRTKPSYPDNAMIVRGVNVLGGNKFLVASNSPLNVIWPEHAVITLEETLAEANHSLNYVYEATILPNHQDLDTLYITHADGVSPINTIFVSGPYEVLKWYGGGYTNLANMETRSIGTYISVVPLTAPDTKDFSYMFPQYFYQNIAVWDVEQATNMDYMFGGVNYYPYDLSHWCVGNIPNEPDNFRFRDELDGVVTALDPVWGTCSIKPDWAPPPPPYDPSSLLGVDYINVNRKDTATIYYARSPAVDNNTSVSITLTDPIGPVTTADSNGDVNNLLRSFNNYNYVTSAVDVVNNEHEAYIGVVDKSWTVKKITITAGDYNIGLSVKTSNSDLARIKLIPSDIQTPANKSELTVNPGDVVKYALLLNISNEDRATADKVTVKISNSGGTETHEYDFSTLRSMIVNGEFHGLILNNEIEPELTAEDREAAGIGDMDFNWDYIVYGLNNNLSEPTTYTISWPADSYQRGVISKV